MRILLFGIIFLLLLSYKKYKKIETFDIECSCKNGIAVESNDCNDKNKQLCDSCNSGYRLVNKLCISKCICNNGIPHEGKECDENEKSKYTKMAADDRERWSKDRAGSL